MVTFRSLACVFLLLCLAHLCRAQEVRVRVINAENGRPLQKQGVSVSFLYDKKYDKEIPTKYDAVLNIETDVNGEAHFKLPEPSACALFSPGSCGLVALEMWVRGTW